MYLNQWAEEKVCAHHHQLLHGACRDPTTTARARLPFLPPTNKRFLPSQLWGGATVCCCDCCLPLASCPPLSECLEGLSASARLARMGIVDHTLLPPSHLVAQCICYPLHPLATLLLPVPSCIRNNQITDSLMHSPSIGYNPNGFQKIFLAFSCKFALAVRVCIISGTYCKCTEFVCPVSNQDVQILLTYISQIQHY